jgi:hypothetical protein
MLGNKKMNLRTMIDMRNQDSASFAKFTPKSGCNKCPENKVALQRAAVNSAPDAVPPIMHEVLRSPGQPLDRKTREFMEPRFGHDFSHVRAHSDDRVAESTISIGDVQSPINLGLLQTTLRIGDPKDNYEQEADRVAQQVMNVRLPLSMEKDKALIFGHASEHGVANQTRTQDSNIVMNQLNQRKFSGRVVQLDQAGDKKKEDLPKATPNDIVKEIGPRLKGPYADFNEFEGKLKRDTFLSHRIRVHPEFLNKLKTAEKNIDEEFRKSGVPIPSGYGITDVKGFEARGGMHTWGLAIDIDVAKNPYIMHEKRNDAGAERMERKLDSQLIPVYHRIAEFMLNEPIGDQQSIIPAIITRTGKGVRGESGKTRAQLLGEYYDRLAMEGQAMRDYFNLMQDSDTQAIPNFLNGTWKQKHPSQSSAPLVDDVRRIMWEDYATLGGSVPQGGPPSIPGFHAPESIGNVADRPFKRPEWTPAGGFLNIPREVVIGLGQAVTRWGAIDFGGASGDVMHFDDRNDLGIEIDSATVKAKNKIRAAAGTTAALETASSDGGEVAQIKIQASTITPIMQPQSAFRQPDGDDKRSKCRDDPEYMLFRVATDTVSEVPPIVHEVLQLSGQPLDPKTCSFMESRFGHDFSQVKVHTDDKSAESAQAVNALAYTVGQDIVFGSGRYAPDTLDGKKLLAHELTHTIQQHSAKSSIVPNISESPEYEREADTIADGIVSIKSSKFVPRNMLSRFMIARQAAPSGGMTHKFQAEFESAAVTAEVPVSWATDPDLMSLVRSESRFDPEAKNPGSSAFGLFQFIRSTWKSLIPEVPYGTVDPYWQAVGGFRYIKQAYRSPTRAWKFFQATTKKDSSLAPPDLQKKAQEWIDKKWAGH